MSISRSSRKIFSKFYDENVDKVYRFIFLKISSKEISQDLCSEVFLRFWEQLETIEIKTPRAFVYRVARNLIADYYRKSNIIKIQPEPEEGEIVVKDSSPNPHEKAVLSGDLETLQASLAKLPDGYQNALIWYYLDEIPIFEISELLNRSESATRVVIHRALTALRCQMAAKS